MRGTSNRPSYTIYHDISMYFSPKILIQSSEFSRILLRLGVRSRLWWVLLLERHFAFASDLLLAMAMGPCIKVEEEGEGEAAAQEGEEMRSIS